MRFAYLLLLSSVLCAAESWQGGSLAVTVDDTGRVLLARDGTTLLNYDQLQLVATQPGWRGVYGFGSSQNVEVVRQDNGCRVTETIPNGMSCTRDLQVFEDGVKWRLAWEYPAGTGANQCYYFLDIPAALVDGAPCEYASGEAIRLGALPANCGEMEKLDGIRLYAKGVRLTFELGGENVVWNLTDWSTSQHKSYRLRVEAPATEGGKAVATVELRVAPCTEKTIAGLRAQWREREAAERQKMLEAQGIRSRLPLGVGLPQVDAPVPQGGRIDLPVLLAATFDNPYDPDDVALDMEVTRPDGTVDRVPGYFDVPVQWRADGTYAGLGRPTWRVRYTPTQIGSYQYRMVLRDRSGQVKTPPATFACVPPASPFRGFVRVCPAQPYAYQFDDGTPYLPIGYNVFDSARLGSPYPDQRLARLSEQVQHLADAGGTFIRLRMDSWWLAIEGTPDAGLGNLGPGLYNQRVCDEIDRLMALCEQRDVKVMLCLYNANAMVNGSVRKDGPTAWRRNYAFFLQDNGGPCADRFGFWTDPTVRKWVRMKLRYSVARWGASPSLMCWEFWNELVFDQKLATEQVAWHREMGDYLRGIDPWRHPITNSLMGHDLENQGPIWELPTMDIVQIHSYRGDELPVYMDRVARTSHRLWRKPFFFGEYGIIHEDHSQGTYPYDPDGVHMHNGLWAPVMAGTAPGAFWFVSGYIEKQHLYGQYTTLAKWTADMAWTDPALRSLEVAGFQYATPPPLADGTVAGTPVDPFAKAKVDRFVVDPATGAVSDPEWFQSMLHMSDERKSCPTLVLDCAADAVLEIRVTTSVGDESNRLLVTVDGAQPLVKAFPAGKGQGTSSTYIEQYGNWRTSYDQTVAIPLAVGKHEVRLEGVGKDRLELRLALRNYFRAPPVVVTGQRTDGAVWLWARHRLSTAYNLRAGKRWEPATGVTCLLADVADGTYDIEWTDPWTGTVTTATATASNGQLALPIPPVQRDLAAKIRRR